MDMALNWALMAVSGALRRLRLQCKVTNLSITQMEESLICSTDTNQMFTFPLQQSDILKTEEMNFEFLHHPLHAGVR